MTRAAAKKKLNKILDETTKGFFNDEHWQPVHAAFKAIREEGFEVDLLDVRYGHDEQGEPNCKTWLFAVILETGKPLYGVVNAHAAGSVACPLDRYDITAYVS